MRLSSVQLFITPRNYLYVIASADKIGLGRYRIIFKGIRWLTSSSSLLSSLLPLELSEEEEDELSLPEEDEALPLFLPLSTAAGVVASVLLLPKGMIPLLLVPLTLLGLGGGGTGGNSNSTTGGGGGTMVVFSC